MPLLYFFYSCLSIFFYFGRVVFFIDTVSMVVYATICVRLGYGYVTVAYLPAWLVVVFLFFCFVLFGGVLPVCLCYSVGVRFKGKEK